MRESSSVSARVREQFSILVENINTLARFRQEVRPGPMSEQVDREFLHHIAALGELRERAFRGVVSGDSVTPLEEPFSLVEVVDLTDFILGIESSPQLSH